MKKLFFTALLVCGIVTLAAQTYNMQIKMKNGEIQTIPADDVEEVTFVAEEPAPDPDEINLLTPEYTPDEALRAWINVNLAGGSGVYTIARAESYNGELRILKNTEIQDLTGLEYFKNVSYLDIQYCTNVNTATIPFMENIIYFNCMNCNFLNFDPLASFPNVETLIINCNKFSGILKLESEKLTYLDCYFNPDLTGIDVSGCPNLKTLVCTNCNLSSIELGNAPIEGLYCYGNSNLKYVNIDNIRSTLKEYTVSSTGMTDLDVSNCTALEYLEFQDGFFTGKIDLTGCTALETLRCQNSWISGYLDLSSLKNLKYLWCFSNQITGLDVSGLSQLEWIYGYYNNFEEIKLDGCTSLNQLYIYNNDLTRIDLSGCSQEVLERFDCEENNDLTEIKVWPDFDINNPPTGYYKPEDAEYVYSFTGEIEDADPTNLLSEIRVPDAALRQWISNTLAGGGNYYSLELAENYSERLVITNNDEIVSLEGLQYFKNCSGLEVSNCVNLDSSSIPTIANATYVCIQNCGVSNFNATACFPKVRNLILKGNDFTGDVAFVSNSVIRIDLSQNPNIVNIDFTGCTTLQQIEVTESGVKSINAAGLPLTSVNCYDNDQLVSLDISNTSIEELYAYNTALKSINLTGCSELYEAEINNGQLEGTLGLAGCTSLSTLKCQSNNIDRIDISDSTRLRSFNCTSNEGLSEIKVWNTFDVATPPSGFQKPTQAQYVYEFSEEE